jgi:Spy/CpxP family protein refolding chaperone
LENIMKLVVSILALSVLATGCGSLSPYAAHTGREIKALSPSEITSLKNGSGMGYAMAAELNQYPGPMHVLEFAKGMGLSAEQKLETEQLMVSHKSEARALGMELIEAERQLNELFVTKQATDASVRQQTEKVALVQAKLRASHLVTHVKQTALLSKEQVARYQSLRGY